MSIRGQNRSTQTKCLAQHSLHPVSVHRALQLSFADDETQVAPRIRCWLSHTAENCRIATGWFEPTTRHRTAASRSGGTHAESDRSQRTRHTDRRFRPFALRALMTFWPLRVDIRARKPCVRLRFSTLGWNVRFMMIRPREPKGSGILRSTIRSVNLVERASCSLRKEGLLLLVGRSAPVYNHRLRSIAARRARANSSCGYARWKRSRDEPYFSEMNCRESYPQAMQRLMHTFRTARLSHSDIAVEDCCHAVSG